MNTPPSTPTQEGPKKAYPVECAWCHETIPDQTCEVPNSSGICHSCMHKHFPDIVAVMERERKAS